MLSEVFVHPSLNYHAAQCSLCSSGHRHLRFWLINKVSPKEELTKFLFVRLSAGDISNKDKQPSGALYQYCKVTEL